MAEEPVALGQRLARGLRGIGGRPDPRKLAERLGVDVIELAAPPQAQPGLRSEYRPSPPRILVYRSALERLSEALPEGRSSDGDVMDLHIAHELFHFLEEEEELEPLDRAAAEQAAQAFAGSLLELSASQMELLRPHEL